MGILKYFNGYGIASHGRQPKGSKNSIVKPSQEHINYQQYVNFTVLNTLGYVLVVVIKGLTIIR
jgi:hypothetical protein